MMNIKKTDIENITKKAIDLVDGIDGEFKTIVFSIIFEKLLESNIDVISEIKETVSQQHYSEPEILAGKQRFADSCGITIAELEKILDIRTNSVQLLITLSGRDADKQRLSTKCILTAFSIVFKKEWVSSATLANCLQLSAISVHSLPRNLKQDKEIRIKGHGKGSELEYTATGPGKTATFEIIKNLSKGEHDKTT